MKRFVENEGSLPSAVPLPLRISSEMASDQVKGFSERADFNTIKKYQETSRLLSPSPLRSKGANLPPAWLV